MMVLAEATASISIASRKLHSWCLHQIALSPKLQKLGDNGWPVQQFKRKRVCWRQKLPLSEIKGNFLESCGGKADPNPKIRHSYAIMDGYLIIDCWC
eukprot:scaffold2242_cov57-Cyclotella_meneghiniana.AAC.5